MNNRGGHRRPLYSTSKTVNGVRQEYYYDENGQLLYEIKDGVYELYYKYDADGNLFSITRYRYSDGAKHVLYAITNSRGDVIELRENSGAIYATYTYDSWGRCVSVKNSSGAACSVNTVAVQNSIRYRGYVYDYETGIYYLQSRYYDPEVGRFLNADDVDFIGATGTVNSYNAFAYCENEPVNDSDPSGFASLKYIAFGIQFCLTIGKITGGFEVVFQKIKKKWQVFLFFFAGTTTSFDLKKSFLNSITQKIKAKKNKVGKLSLSNLKDIDMSIAFFVILGNKKATLLDNYIGWFSGGSIRTWKKIILTGAISKNKYSGAIIGSLGIGLTTSSSRVSFAQTYYCLYSGKDTLKSLVSSLRQDIYDEVAFMGNLGALLL